MPERTQRKRFDELLPGEIIQTEMGSTYIIDQIGGLSALTHRLTVRMRHWDGRRPIGKECTLMRSADTQINVVHDTIRSIEC